MPQFGALAPALMSNENNSISSTIIHALLRLVLGYRIVSGGYHAGVRILDLVPNHEPAVYNSC